MCPELNNPTRLSIAQTTKAHPLEAKNVLMRHASDCHQTHRETKLVSVAQVLISCAFLGHSATSCCKLNPNGAGGPSRQDVARSCCYDAREDGHLSLQEKQVTRGHTTLCTVIRSFSHSAVQNLFFPSKSDVCRNYLSERGMKREIVVDGLCHEFLLRVIFLRPTIHNLYSEPYHISLSLYKPDIKYHFRCKHIGQFFISSSARNVLSETKVSDMEVLTSLLSSIEVRMARTEETTAEVQQLLQQRRATAQVP